MDGPLYDTHAHVYTDDVARYPVNLRNSFHSEEELLRRITNHPITPERLLEAWDEQGIAAGAGVQYSSIYKTDNSFLLDSSDRYSDRLSAVVILDATHPETPARLARFVTERGVAGLRLTGGQDASGGYPWLDSEAALATWRVAADHALPVALMYIPQGPHPVAIERIAGIARRFPGLVLALDHLGWPGYDATRSGPSDAIGPLVETPNILFKATSINFRLFREQGIDAAGFIRRFADRVGAGRMMWGSDYGNTLQTYSEMTTDARESAGLLSAPERLQYLHDTGMNLFARGTGPRVSAGQASNDKTGSEWTG